MTREYPQEVTIEEYFQLEGDVECEDAIDGHPT